MKVIIPASGEGLRFKNAGYVDPKPLINVNDKKIIDYVLNCFSANDEFFIISSPSTYDRMDEYLTICKMSGIQITHILYEGPKLGPVGCILGVAGELSKYIKEHDEVIVSYCDYGLDWNYYDFLQFIDEVKPDGAIPCYTGYHPHLENENNVYAACKVVDSSNQVYVVKEKYNSNNRETELWSAGLYYFKSFGIMNGAFTKLVEAKDSINSEYYVSLAYNYMEGLNIYAYDKIKKFYQFGTPEDFEVARKNLNMLVNIENEPTTIKNTVVLSAGRGERFLNLGFKQPKPFLPIGRSYLAKYIYSSLNNIGNIRFVGSKDHSLFWDSSGLPVKYIEPNKIGAAYSYKSGCSDIEGDTLIVPCDLIAKHITPLFNKLKETCDAIIFTAEPNDYALENPNSFAWVSGHQSKIHNISIKEKHNSTNELMVLIGSFWVKDNKVLLESIDDIIENNKTVNGEYYLDSAFKNMLDAGLNVKYIKLEKYFSLGTYPEYNMSRYWLDGEFFLYE